MVAGVPGLSLEVDPLIAEAKQRAHRRRLLALCATVIVAAVVVGTALGMRSTGNARGVCAKAPSGWKERIAQPGPLPAPVALVMTNWRFGRMEYVYGLGAQHWPAAGVTVVVRNEGPAATPRIGRALRVNRADFGGFEGMRFPFAEVAVRSHGRVLDAYIEVGSVTPATIASANQALAGVRVCST